MATNSIESLDPALIRPGRIDRKIEFPLPDEKTRRRIFTIHTGRMTLSDDVNLEEYIMAKDDLSGADIKVRQGHGIMRCVLNEEDNVCFVDPIFRASAVISEEEVRYYQYEEPTAVEFLNTGTSIKKVLLSLSRYWCGYCVFPIAPGGMHGSWASGTA